jgi:hypothetical protein
MQVEEIILVLFKKRIHLANDLGGIPTNDAAWLIYRLSDNTSCRDNGIIRNGDTIKQDGTVADKAIVANRYRATDV